MRHRTTNLARWALVVLGCSSPPITDPPDAGSTWSSIDGSTAPVEEWSIPPELESELLSALDEIELGNPDVRVPEAPESTWDAVTVDHSAGEEAVDQAVDGEAADGDVDTDDATVVLDSLVALKSGRDWVLPGRPDRLVLRATPWRRATPNMRALGVRRYRAFYSFQGHGLPYAVRVVADGFAPRREQAVLNVRVNPRAVSRRHTLAQTLPRLEASVPSSWQGTGTANARAATSERIARQLFVASFRELQTVGEPGPGRGLTIGGASTVPKAFGADDGVCDGGVADFWSCMLTLAPIIACASNPVGAAICGIAAAFALETAQALLSGVSGTAGCSGAIWVLATEGNDCTPGYFDVDVACRANGHERTQVGTLSFRPFSLPGNGGEGFIYRNETQSFYSANGTGDLALVMAGPVARYPQYYEVECQDPLAPIDMQCFQERRGFLYPNYYRKTCEQWCLHGPIDGNYRPGCQTSGFTLLRPVDVRRTGPNAPDRSGYVSFTAPSGG